MLERVATGVSAGIGIRIPSRMVHHRGATEQLFEIS
jgi:hypothetical protein